MKGITMSRKTPFSTQVIDTQWRELNVTIKGTVYKQYYQIDQTPISNAQVIKGSDGLRYMLLISSNAWEDREKEIVQEKALQKYVDKSMGNGDYDGNNVLLFWHSDPPDTAYQNRIGDIVHAELKHHFLIEIALERPNAVIDISSKRKGDKPFRVQSSAIWDAMESGGVDYGASIGFMHRAKDKRKNMYENILKFETSVLPVEYAANSITLSEIIS